MWRKVKRIFKKKTFWFTSFTIVPDYRNSFDEYFNWVFVINRNKIYETSRPDVNTIQISIWIYLDNKLQFRISRECKWFNMRAIPCVTLRLKIFVYKILPLWFSHLFAVTRNHFALYVSALQNQHYHFRKLIGLVINFIY